MCEITSTSADTDNGSGGGCFLLIVFVIIMLCALCSQCDQSKEVKNLEERVTELEQKTQRK